MSVILKALRAQSEEVRKDPSSQDAGSEDSFQVDKTGESPEEDRPASRKRQVILLGVLLLSILAFVAIQGWNKSSPTPPPPQALKPVSIPPPASIAVAPQQAQAVPTLPVPSLAPAVNNDLQVARSQYKSGEYEESLKSFQKALDQDPNNSSIHNDMGLVLLKKDLFASAEGHFAKALELNDACAECYNNLGYLKTAMGQPVEAEKYLQKAIMLRPEYADPYFNLAVMYEKNGDIGKAVEFYQAYLKKIPKTDTEVVSKIKSRINDLSGE